MNPSQQQSDNHDPQEDGQWTEPQLRFMKRAIAVMSTILIAGFMLLIWRIMNLTSTTGPSPASTNAALIGSPAGPLTLKSQIELLLPGAARVDRLSLSGRLLAVQYVATTGSGIAIIDLVAGKVVSRIKIKN